MMSFVILSAVKVSVVKMSGIMQIVIIQSDVLVNICECCYGVAELYCAEYHYSIVMLGAIMQIVIIQCWFEEYYYAECCYAVAELHYASVLL